MRARTWVAIGGLLGLFGCPKEQPAGDPKQEADGYYLEAQTAYLKRGDFAAAHAAFAKVRELNPGDPRLPAAEAEVYLSESKLDEALPLLEQAKAADPNRGNVWSRLATLYALKHQPEKAREAVERAIALNPKDTTAFETRGDLQLGQGEVDAGVDSYFRAAQLGPKARRGELVTKATAVLLKRGRAAEALPLLEAAWDAGLDAPEVASELGDRRVEAGRLDEAIVAYTRAAEQSPTDPSLWELVGELQRRLGRRAEARAALGKALALKDTAVVHAELARLCLDEGEKACASAELDKALEVATGESLRETLELADLLATVGRKKDGLALLRTVADEPDQRKNVELQRKVAKLADELKQGETLRAACARVLAAAGPGQRCP